MRFIDLFSTPRDLFLEVPHFLYVILAKAGIHPKN